MIRRKASVDKDVETVEYGNGSNAQIPLGGETATFNMPPRTRRRRKKAQSCFRSWLIHLQLRSDRNKTIETLSGKRKGSSQQRSRSDNSIFFCVLLSGLICLLLVTMGIYYVVATTDDRNGNLILRSSTTIPPDMIERINEFRPPVAELPILLHLGDKHSHHQYGHHSTDGEFYYPSKLHSHSDKADYGGIDMKLLANDDQKRQIYIMVEDLQGDFRSLNHERDDDYEIYWNFDDDKERNPYLLFTDYNDSMEGRCRRVSWHRYNLQACNSMHELDLVTHTPRFVG